MIHPGRLKWNLRIHPWERNIIFQTIIFRFQLLIFGGVCASEPMLTIPPWFQLTYPDGTWQLGLVQWYSKRCARCSFLASRFWRVSKKVLKTLADQPKFPTVGQLCFPMFFPTWLYFWSCYQSSENLTEISMTTKQAQTQILPSCVRDTFVEQRFLDRPTVWCRIGLLWIHVQLVCCTAMPHSFKIEDG